MQYRMSTTIGLAKGKAKGKMRSTRELISPVGCCWPISFQSLGSVRVETHDSSVRGRVAHIHDQLTSQADTNTPVNGLVVFNGSTSRVAIA